MPNSAWRNYEPSSPAEKELVNKLREAVRFVRAREVDKPIDLDDLMDEDFDPEPQERHQAHIGEGARWRLLAAWEDELRRE